VAAGAVQPGKIDARYELTTGGEDQRRLYYAVLKIFGLVRQEWDALPWHDQRMYIEQLNKDPEYNEEGDGQPDSVEITDWGDLPPGV
jgi:hypothetical protein